MATKQAFSPSEWQTLQWAVTDTMTYLSMAEPGFWDTFKEAGAAAKFIGGIKTSGDDLLMRELAADIKMDRDKAATHDPTDIAGAVTARVREAAAIVAAKAPEDLDSFRRFILGVAHATAQAAKGVGPGERAAIAKLEEALG
jgi:hypothetical protein